MTTPPLITSCVFKDKMNESTTNHKKNMIWNTNFEHLKEIKEYHVHDTNHDGFGKDDLKRTLHLLHAAKKTQAILYDHHDDTYLGVTIPPGCYSSLVCLD